VYVALAAARNCHPVAVTVAQLLAAAVVAAAAEWSGVSLPFAIGLVAHAAWDTWHLLRDEPYVPAWYAGACVYVDLAAAAIVLTVV
jgi:hypothetical protein